MSASYIAKCTDRSLRSIGSGLPILVSELAMFVSMDEFGPVTTLRHQAYDWLMRSLKRLVQARIHSTVTRPRFLNHCAVADRRP